ncbi:hypothetical protein [Sphingomonas sp. LT1P40]|uniref:hypothetical protein n=1 Tax=Alteristakelama amylovorans TaxID=3096166 RepID=UPI002FCAE679
MKFLRQRKLRLGIVLGIAVIAAYVAWRTGSFSDQPQQKACVEGRKEVKDDKGQVVQVLRTTCFDETK